MAKFQVGSAIRGNTRIFRVSAVLEDAQAIAWARRVAKTIEARRMVDHPDFSWTYGKGIVINPDGDKAVVIYRDLEHHAFVLLMET